MRRAQPRAPDAAGAATMMWAARARGSPHPKGRDGGAEDGRLGSGPNAVPPLQLLHRAPPPS